VVRLDQRSRSDTPPQSLTREVAPSADATELREQVALLTDALNMQRQLFDEILREEKSKRRELSEGLEARERAFADELTALQLECAKLDGERQRLQDDNGHLVEQYKTGIARITRAHFESLSSLRRAYQKRLEQAGDA
jgi:predicted nuclease with TOPRIM domain